MYFCTIKTTHTGNCLTEIFVCYCLPVTTVISYSLNHLIRSDKDIHCFSFQHFQVLLITTTLSFLNEFVPYFPTRGKHKPKPPASTPAINCYCQALQVKEEEEEEISYFRANHLWTGNVAEITFTLLKVRLRNFLERG